MNPPTFIPIPYYPQPYPYPYPEPWGPFITWTTNEIKLPDGVSFVVNNGANGCAANLGEVWTSETVGFLGGTIGASS